jgi:hypothetical protein
MARRRSPAATRFQLTVRRLAITVALSLCAFGAHALVLAGIVSGLVPLSVHRYGQARVTCLLPYGPCPLHLFLTRGIGSARLQRVPSRGAGRNRPC